MLVGITGLAIDFYQPAEKISHRGLLHETVVVVVWTIAGPNFRPRFDVLQSDENKVGILAKLPDGGILKMGFDAVDPARRKIRPAHIAAEIFAVEILVRMGFRPGAFRNRSQVMVARGVIFSRDEVTAQLANNFALFDHRDSKQSISCTRYGGRFYDRALIVFFVDLEHWNKLRRSFIGKERECAATEHQCKKK